MNEEVETGRTEGVAGPNEGADLESVMHLIWDRLDGAEAERLRSRRHAALLATAVLAVAVLWTGFPHRASEGPVLLRDGDGHVRARFETDPESGRTTLQLIDAQGSPQAILGADVAGPMLTFYDKQGSARMRVGLEDGSEAPIVDVVDQPSGEQTRVDLVSLRNAGAVPLPPNPRHPVVRQASSRGVTAPSPVEYHLNPACPPGMLGCARVTRVERSRPADG